MTGYDIRTPDPEGQRGDDQHYPRLDPITTKRSQRSLKNNTGSCTYMFLTCALEVEAVGRELYVCFPSL